MRRQRQQTLVAVLFASIFVVSFQNCSQGGFKIPDGSTSQSSQSGSGVAGEPGLVVQACTENPAPAAAPMQRLTKAEYNNVVRDLFGLTTDFSANFAGESPGPVGFTTEAVAQPISPDMVNNYWNASLAVSEAVFKLTPNPFMLCTTAGEVCARKNITDFAVKAFRRPITTEEADRLMVVYRASTSTVFADSMKLVLQSMLLAPQFILRTYDLPTDNAAVASFSNYELAGRISFFVWGSIPDDALRADAASGAIKDPAVMESHVRRMLKDPRAKYLQTSFAKPWLKLSNFDGIQLDTTRFPTWNATLKASMKRETELFIENVFVNDRSVMDFINGQYSYMDQSLSTHYKVPGPTTTAFALVPNPSSRGILTQASILAMNSNSVHTTPVKRGKWSLDVILCADPGPPPPGAGTLPISGNGIVYSESQIRERMAAHTAAGSTCVACHKTLDPVGYAYENYDSSGQFRSQYTDGVTVNATGVMPTGEKLNGINDLVNLFQNDIRYRRCFVSRLSSFAQGRDATTFTESCANQNTALKSIGPKYKMSDAVVAIVKSNSFRNRTVQY